MERDLLVERTQSGLARAKAEGKALGRPARTTAGDRAKIVALHATGLSLAVIAAKFGIGNATVHAVIAGARTAAQAPAPTTPAKPAKAIRKAAARCAGNDMADRATLERKRGQRRVPAV